MNFMQANNIVSRPTTGKLSVSFAEEELIEREVAFHLGRLQRDFSSGLLSENRVYNDDETLFVFDLHNHKTLAVRGDTGVKYVDM